MKEYTFFIFTVSDLNSFMEVTSLWRDDPTKEITFGSFSLFFLLSLSSLACHPQNGVHAR